MEIGDGASCCSDANLLCSSETTTSDSATLHKHGFGEASNNYTNPNNAANSNYKRHSNGIQKGILLDKLDETQHRWSLFPPLVPTISKDEVPALFREPHVERGFRVLHRPWSYYIWSIFQLHNESMNVWTHILASMLMMKKLIYFSSHVDFLNDQYSWPLLAGLLSGIALYTFSSAAHCLQSKSEIVHYVAFMFDYAGIGLYGLGSVIVHLWYCSEPNFYEAVRYYFIPIGCLLGFLICYCCTVAKISYTRPYPFVRKVWQMSPVGSIYVVLVSPIVHRLWSCYIYGDDCNDSIPYHVHQVLWFIISGIFFATDIPQRWIPGRCDHFFHSHQLFHFAIMMSTLQQMDGVFIDFRSRSHIFRMYPAPSFADAFGPILVVFIAEMLCILFFTLKIKSKIGHKKVC